MAKNTSTTRLGVIAVDVRGTLIDPYQDLMMDLELADCLWQFVRNGGFVGIVTATSLKSLHTLLIPQLMSSLTTMGRDSNLLDRFILYVDSGTAAYTLNAEGGSIPLNGYPFVSFSAEQISSVLNAIEVSNRSFSWSKPKTKIKAGQINFYCGGQWGERLALAQFLRSQLLKKAEPELFVMVPSAKDTIDIALRDKSYSIHDLLFRSGCSPRSLLIVGDSLQTGGADSDMFSAAPDALAIQVGPFKPALPIRHLQDYGPNSTLTILREVLRWR